jgi:hypothetical protein
MAIGRLSIRSQPGNRLHHLYRNNGPVFRVHYTLHFDFRKRRIRRSLGTRDAEEAIRRRDELFARLAREGEHVPERRPAPRPTATSRSRRPSTTTSQASCRPRIRGCEIHPGKIGRDIVTYTVLPINDEFDSPRRLPDATQA